MKTKNSCFKVVTCTLPLLTTLLAVCPALAVEYHVAVTGSDNNAGTQSSPFQSLSKAAAQAQPGDICVIHAGTYRETLKPARSGNAGSPIVFRAASGESVTISGADPITGWTLESGNTYKASMSWDIGEGLNQVFADGKMIFEARFPNPGPDPMRPVLAKMTLAGNSLSSSEFTQTAGFWNGGTFHGWIGESWTSQAAKITSSALGKVELTNVSTPWFQGQGNGYLTGVKAALDAPGEWFYQGGTLFVQPPIGSNLSDPRIEAKRRGWAIDLNGLSYVQVKGINVFAASVRLTGDNCLVENMRARYLSHFTHGGNGYYKTDKAELGRNGVQIGGSGNVLSVCEVEYSAGTGVILGGSENRVSDCVIHSTNYAGLYCAPVILEGNKNTLEWSNVYDAGRDAMHISGTTHSIMHNDFSNPGMLNSDLGVIYTNDIDAKGTVIAYNYIHDNPGKHGISPCLYIDFNSRNYVVHHNVVWNCGSDAGIRLNGPTLGHKVYNNTLFNSDDVGTHIYYNSQEFYSYSKSNNLLLKNPATEMQNVASGDFRLANGSPYIDKGEVLAGFTDGFKGAAPDLGAYETGGEAWKAGARSQPGSGTPVLNSQKKRLDSQMEFRNGEISWAGKGIPPAQLTLYNRLGRAFHLPQVRPRVYAPQRSMAQGAYFVKTQNQIIPILTP